MGKKKNDEINAHELLRLPHGPVDVATIATDGTPGFDSFSKKDFAKLTEDMLDELSDLQERLFANGRSNPEGAASVLIVLQGMDTSGKGGIIRHAIGMVDPQGVHIKAFKGPTAEERKHDFLWRIERELPAPGMIGIFDRSQYEDVLIQRVEKMVTQDVWEARYDQINDFEAKVAAGGTRIVKCFLHVSADEQKARLTARLEDQTKHWKYNPGDLDARAKWDEYEEAYDAALTHCNTDAAPWFVIPADDKSYRNWAVAQLLLETLRDMDLQWPAADFDVEAEKARVAAS